MEALAYNNVLSFEQTIELVKPEVKWSKVLWDTCENRSPQHALEIVTNRTVVSEASDKYVSMPTIELLAELLEQGLEFTWRVDLYKGCRKELTGMHRVVIVPKISLSDDLDRLGNLAIYLYNSSDRSMRFGIFAGWLEWACLNGCFTGELLFDENNQGLFIRQKHIHTSLDQMKEKIQTVAKTVKDYLVSEKKREFTNFMNNMVKTKISEEKELELARKILEKRISLYPWHTKKFLANGGNFVLRSSVEDYVNALKKSARDAHRGQSYHQSMQRIQEGVGANPSLEKKDKNREAHIPKGLQYEINSKDENGNVTQDLRSIHQIKLNDPNKISELNLYITEIYKEALEEVAA